MSVSVAVRRKASSSLYLKRGCCYVVMIFLALLAVVPVYILLVNATRSTEQINAGISLIPGTNIGYNWNALTSRGF